MIGMYAAVAAALIAAGAALGIVALTTLGIRREERTSRREGGASLLAGSRDRASGSARIATGVYTRNPLTAYPAGRQRDSLLVPNGDRQ
jgi:hypothetical protein